MFLQLYLKDAKTLFKERNLLNVVAVLLWLFLPLTHDFRSSQNKQSLVLIVKTHFCLYIDTTLLNSRCWLWTGLLPVL